MSAVVKVWIDEGCITCDACENTCPEVFQVVDDTCIIIDGINPGEFSDDIIEAAEGCPVDVILYEMAGADEAPTEESPAEESSPPEESPVVVEVVGDGPLDAIMTGDRDVHILFGSQSGNAESLCALMAKKAASYGLVGHVHDMDGFELGSMVGMKRVLIACSTWGEGDMPDNAEELYNQAVAAGKTLSNTHFSVCSLGDSSYEFYCESGKQWDAVLEKLGGTRIHDRVDCDVDYDSPAGAWMLEALSKVACIDDSGAFHEDLVELMSAKAAGDSSSGSSGDVANVVQPEIAFTTSVFRYDAMSGESGIDTWACSMPGHHSVLELLRALKTTQDGSLTFRDGTPDDPTTGVCVNGRLVLPGLTRLCDVARDKGEGAQIRIEPLSAYIVIRDLAVDLSSYENLRAATKPWFVGGEREGSNTSQTVIGVMDAAVATELHKSGDVISPQLLHAASDTVPHNESYMGPALVGHLWNRSCDPRVSDSARTSIIETLAGTDGVKAEADMSSIQRQGRMGATGSSNLLEAKNAVLAHDGYNGRHGKHVWWFTWTVKSSGVLNETILAAQTMGPAGMVKNLPQMIRMATGFTRGGSPMMRDFQGFVAPGKMPPIVNSSIDNHHEVVAIYNAFDSRF
ncbi:MAG: flavodoxin domain-containing protein [Candidatus Thalassarchaeaceae archaeon]|jgi:succinate dehydrogenase/fumarate reductase-like Fe-S protein/flavodoxin/ferredoxin|nr:flavodoxin domain-containing protein [Candidatus Thalassarchaeaceae archaeon]